MDRKGKADRHHIPNQGPRSLWQRGAGQADLISTRSRGRGTYRFPARRQRTSAIVVNPTARKSAHRNILHAEQNILMTYFPHTASNVVPWKRSKASDSAPKRLRVANFRQDLDDTSLTWEKDHLAGVSKPGQGRRPGEL